MADQSTCPDSTTEQVELLKAALDYVARGWPVLPVYSVRDGQCTCGRRDCPSPGKHPRTPRGVHDASVATEVIGAWWQDWPDSNVGVATGAESKLVVMDVDHRHGGAVSLEALQLEHGNLQETAESETPGGGHRYFGISGHAGKLRNKVNLAPGIDIRADGGYVVAPPSRHISGGVYRWKPRKSPREITPAPAPKWLLEALRGPDRAAPVDPAAETIASGMRNATLTSIAGALRQRGLGREAIEAALQQENVRRCQPPLPESEVRSIAASVSRYPVGRDAAAATFALTDVGNAERLRARHGHDLFYVFEWKRWMNWDGQRWARDAGDRVVNLAVDTVRQIGHEAAQEQDQKRRREIHTHAIKSESRAKLTAMVSLAEALLPATPNQFDSDPYLLNCLNGTVDLRRGQLLPHRREDLITKLVPTVYDPSAECPTWLAFVDRVLGGDPELTCFVQRALGYSLTAKVTEQVLLMLYGTGANGKTTFVNAVLAILGDYGKRTPTETLLAGRQGGIPNDIAALRGTRFVAAVEAEEGRRFSEVLVKELTGGDVISARFLFGEYFEFHPTFKLWVSVNHRPIVRGTDHAIWRRIRLVPFSVTIPESERDPFLGERLQLELPGILRWAVEGCLEWQSRGLDAPRAVRQATDAYRAEMDVLATYIAERCLFGEEYAVSASDLYGDYRQWAQDSGEKPLSQKVFGTRLTERGFERQRGAGGRLHYKGIALPSLLSPDHEKGERWQ